METNTDDALQPIAGVTDPGITRWLWEIRRNPSPPCREMGADALRAASAARAATRLPGPEMWEVTQRKTPHGPEVRMYYPVDPAQHKLPAVIYLHGGGFVIGSLDSHDAICRRLAREAQAVVVSLDYKLAPEHLIIEPLEDAQSTYSWLKNHLSRFGCDASAGISFAGDSAGGMLAILAGLILGKKRKPLNSILAVYPNADATLSFPSVHEKSRGWGLDLDDMSWFLEQSHPAEASRLTSFDPLALELRGLPTTMVVTDEHDILRDEGLALVERLRAQDVTTQHLHYEGLVHGFLGLTDISEQAASASREIFTTFGELLRRNVALER